jgi:branched-chain amino acid transport system ATP-binding protein
MEVEDGELVVILGANGSGKTTFMRTISGLTKPRTGIIEFAGMRIDRMGPDSIVRVGISHCPEGRKLFPNMTVFKNLILGAYVRRGSRLMVKETMHDVFRLFPILEERQQQQAGTLSGGEQQMLAIGRALMSKPRLLLLDEPSQGVAPLVVARIFDNIKSINEGGTTILLVEQNAAVALNIAHRAYVLEGGEIILTGEAKELFNNEIVRQAYLGVR